MNSLDESVVLDLLLQNPREQVRYDAIEERKIVRQKLWDIDILQTSQQEHFLVIIWEVPLEITRRSDDRLYRSHTAVIVILT